MRCIDAICGHLTILAEGVQSSMVSSLGHNYGVPLRLLCLDKRKSGEIRLCSRIGEPIFSILEKREQKSAARRPSNLFTTTRPNPLSRAECMALVITGWG
jgi:hypothetical protein